MRNTVIYSDALTALKSLPDGVARCAVTSPPYWAMRDYDGHRQWFDEENDRTWSMGGYIKCDHDKDIEHGPHHPGQVEETKWKGAEGAGKGQTALTYSCSKCGAWYGQLGQEPELEDYIRHLVDILRQVKRVLTTDGSMWINIGDTLKDKQLLGVPWRLALALQADGWILRSEVIWSKELGGKPESVKDRPVRCHEHVFFLVKSEKYFSDFEAVRVPTVDGSDLKSLRDVWNIPYEPLARVRYKKESNFAVFPSELPRRCILASSQKGDLVLDPFAGSGTTLGVARRLGRDYLGIEANETFKELIERRVDDLGGSVPLDAFEGLGA